MAQLFFITLAQAGRGERIGEALAIMVVGMGVVFVALVLVGVLLAALRKVAEPAPPPAKPRRSPAPTIRTPPPAQVVEDRIDERTLAVIAAAAAAAAVQQRIDGRTLAILAAAATAAVGGPARIRRVQVLRRTEQAGRSGWAEQGRVAIHTSHNTQTRKR